MIHKYEAGSLPTKPANRLETDTFYRIVSSLNSLLLAQDDLKARAHLIPGGWRDLRACMALMEKSGVICTPGSSFGPLGEGYVRFALVMPPEKIAEAVQAIAQSGVLAPNA